MHLTKKECDLLIIGAGPAGLSAAVNAASEGLKTVIIDSSDIAGGQIRNSSCVKNYPGFPHGITGRALTSGYLDQVLQFHHAEFIPSVTAIGLREMGDHVLVTTKHDKCMFGAQSVILGSGLSYNHLAVPGVGTLEGRGVSYGATEEDPMSLSECTVCIIGGANSAGQAAVNFARNPNVNVKVLIRSTIETGMSTYLIEEIRERPNVEVMNETEVVRVNGTTRLESVSYRRRLKVGATIQTVDDTMEASQMCIFIGASPKTYWLKRYVEMDPRGFIQTGIDLAIPPAWHTVNEERLRYGTSMPGVFCIGDVRAGSTKRVAAAVGEGASVVPNIHKYLSQRSRIAA